MRHALASLAALVLAGILPASAALAEDIPGTPFSRERTVDALGRTVTYYLSDGDVTRPLALLIQGSGCNALFRPIPAGGYTAVGYHNVLRGIGGHRYRVLAVEKPGARFINDQPIGGNAEDCPKAFLEEHTVDRWATALSAAMAAARRAPFVDAERSLVIGHSEGGVLAARLARLDPKVRHVALLASPGPDPVEELAIWGESRKRPRAETLALVDRIRASPDSTTEFALGHPYRRWASFLAADPVADLVASDAFILLAHGDADTNWPVAAHELLATGFQRAKRSFMTLRIVDADHSFNRTGQRSPEGMAEAFKTVINWTAEFR